MVESLISNPDQSVRHRSLTWSSISFVWPAEIQKRTRDSVSRVAGNPTVTTAQPRFNISRLTALETRSNNQRANVPIAWTSCLRYLSGHEDHNRYNGRVIIAIDNETHVNQLSTEIAHITGQLLNTFLTLRLNRIVSLAGRKINSLTIVGTIATHNDTQCSDDLINNRCRHTRWVACRMRVNTNMID